MNFKLKNLTLLFLAFGFLISCGNDDSGDTAENGAADGEFIADIDGTSFSVVAPNAGAILFNGAFNLTAVNNSTGETITITITNASEGTFDLGPDANGDTGAAYTRNGEGAYLSVAEGGSGEINISKLDVDNELVSGTFSFVGTRNVFDDNGDIVTETVTISGGAFNNLPLATELPGGNSSLSADVDGDALNADSVIATEISLLGETTISITAINNTTAQNIGLSFPGDAEAGTYELGGLFADYKGSYNPNLGGGTNIYIPSDGTITITSIDTAAGTAEGTFEFTAVRLDPSDPDVTYEITNGSFSAEW